ncbi:apolipoprotein D-like [Phymastichus coffea]|uniref:apolipoprotein D-like n=1 Tax=Phymastichus coffea TaxID=108790 RepID=UPI00273C66DE|nr:apolipoprotein D-like [Phymastichus coffea]
MKSVVLLLVVLAVAAKAQIPSLGFCPEYQPKENFTMERFAGVWYEAERYFQLTEVASRCVRSNYTLGPDKLFHVTNEVTSRFTGIKRVLEGVIRKSPLKTEEGKLHVKYTTVPLIPLETQYNVLDTDYDSYAVLWSCSGIGPVHAQNAWIMTRSRNPSIEIMQKAYAVLQKYKISQIFFVKTNHDDCAYLDTLAAEASSAAPTEPPKVEDEIIEEAEETPQPLRSAPITPDAPEAIIQTRKAEVDALKAKPVEAPEPVVPAAAAAAAAAAEESVKSVPEVIMKIADQAKEKKQEAALAAVASEPVKEPAKEPIKEQKPANEPKETAPVVADEKKQQIVEEQIEIVKP